MLYSAMGDFHELKLEFRRVWSPVQVGAHNAVSNTWGANTRTAPRSPSLSSSAHFSNSNSTSAVGTPNHSHSHSRAVSGFNPSVSGAGSGAAAQSPVEAEVSPGVRFCHVGVVYEGSLYIFGGYDGTQR
jgi:hypothetical protein